MRKNSILTIILCSIIVTSFTQTSPVFKILSGNEVGVAFKNIITESDSLNINISGMPYLYAGGGVGILDFNNDGLQDIVMQGNQVSSKLYMNKGNFHFEDVSNSMGITTTGWTTAVLICDVNTDGWQDIYFLKAQNNDSRTGGNVLYINQQGKGFIEQSHTYNLDINDRFLAGSFFDYDNDGDQDLYLAKYPNNSKIGNDINFDFNASFERIYGNDLLLENKNGRYYDVSEQAGIIKENGFGISVLTADFNNDNLTDIYVGNDFSENDFLYINNGNKTFTESIKKYFNHTSFFTMGLDYADMDNDGLGDLISLDMNPPDLKKYKLDFSSFDYEIYKATEKNYHFQEIRNCLQFQNPDTSYSDYAQIDKVAFTDWSWTPLIADFDMNGTKDIFITNGLKRDILNQNIYSYQLDSFLRHHNKGWDGISNMDILNRIPPMKLKNYFFSNENKRSFTNVSDTWANQDAGISTGAALADFDNDGDIDIAINNIDDTMMFYENQKNSKNNFKAFYIKNLKYLNSKIRVYTTKKVYSQEIVAQRGFISTSQAFAVFAVPADEEFTRAEIYFPATNRYVDIADVYSSNWFCIDSFSANVEIKKSETNKEPIKKTIYTYTELPKHSVFKKQAFLFKDNTQHSPISSVWYNDKYDFAFIGAYNQQDASILKFDKTSKNYITTSIPNSKSYSDISIAENNIGGKTLNRYVLSEQINASGSTSQIISELINSETTPTYKTIWSGNEAFASIAVIKNNSSTYLIAFGRVSLEKYPYNEKHVVFKIEANTLIEDKDLTTSLQAILFQKNIQSVLSIDALDGIYITGNFEPISQLKLLNTNAFTKQIIFNKTGFWDHISYDRNLSQLLFTNMGDNFKYNLKAEDSLVLYVADYDKNGLNDPVILASIEGKEYPIYTYKDFTANISGVRKYVPEIKNYYTKTIQEIFSDVDFKIFDRKSIQTTHNYIYSLSSKSWSDTIPQITNWNCFTSWNGLMLFCGNNYWIRPDIGYNYAASFCMYNPRNKKYNINNSIHKGYPVTNVFSVCSGSILVFTSSRGVYTLQF